MANWYYKHANVEVGPVQASELRQLAGTGKLLPNDEVKRDDMPAWVPANRVKGLFGKDGTQSGPPPVVATPNATPAEPPPSSSHDEPVAMPASGSAGSRLLGTLKKAAVLTAKHAKLKSLLWDLSKADEATGIAAYAGQVGRQSFADLFERIRTIDEDVATKRKATAIPPNESVSDKAKRLAHEAKKKVAIESALSNRTKILRELGEKLREAAPSHDVPALQEQLKQARDAAANVERMKAEIADLSSRSPGLMRKTILVVAICGVLLIGYWGYGYYSAWKQDHDHRAAIAAIESKATADAEAQRKTVLDQQRQFEIDTANRKAEAERLAAESAALERKRVQEQADREAQAKLDEQRRAVEYKKQQLAAEKEERDREFARKEAEKRDEVAAAAREATEQKDRQRLAETEFGRVSLDPAKAVDLSRSMTDAFKATVELRGRDYAKIADLHGQHKWLDLINLLDHESYTELPPARDVEQAAFKLSQKDFKLLVRIDPKLEAKAKGRQLFLISFERNSDGGVVNYGGQWERHPDGIGWIIDWQPSFTHSIVIAASYNEVASKVQHFNEEISQVSADLRSRLRLGEIDEAKLNSKLDDTISRVFDEAKEWASSL